MNATGFLSDLHCSSEPPAVAGELADSCIALLRRVQAHESAALGELYDLTVGKLFALASSILRNREDAEEVVCDVFSQVWKEADRYDPGRANPLGWLLMICRSRALDRLRQRKRSAVSVNLDAVNPMADPTPGPEALLSLIQ